MYFYVCNIERERREETGGDVRERVFAANISLGVVVPPIFA